MQTSRDVTIDGRTFAVGQLGAMQALRLFPLLAKGGTSFTGLSPEEMEKLARGLFSAVQIKGDGGKQAPLEGAFELLFSGKPAKVIELLGVCIEVNYGDFSDGVPAPEPTTLAGAPSPG